MALSPLEAQFTLDIYSVLLTAWVIVIYLNFTFITFGILFPMPYDLVSYNLVFDFIFRM